MAKNADMNLVLYFPKVKGKVQPQCVQAYGSPSALFSHHDDIGITRQQFNMFFFKHKDTNLYENDKCLIVKTQTRRKKEEA